MSSVSVPHRQLEASASFHLLSAGSYSNIASEDLLNFCRLAKKRQRPIHCNSCSSLPRIYQLWCHSLGVDVNYCTADSCTANGPHPGFIRNQKAKVRIPAVEFPSNAAAPLPLLPRCCPTIFSHIPFVEPLKAILTRVCAASMSGAGPEQGLDSNLPCWIHELIVDLTALYDANYYPSDQGARDSSVRILFWWILGLY